MLSIRTQNIIFICKGRYYYPNHENCHRKQALKYYMSQTCFGDLEEEYIYNDSLLLEIIRDCVIDISKNAPEALTKLLYNYFSSSKRYAELDAWMSALSLIQIKDGDEKTNSLKFINGFTHDCVMNENIVDEMLYPDYEKACKLFTNFNYKSAVFYKGNKYKILNFPNVMKVKITPWANRFKDEKEDKSAIVVSIFDISKKKEEIIK